MMKFFTLTFLFIVLAFTNSRDNDIYSIEQAEKIARIALKDKSITLKEKLEITEYFEKSESVSFYLCTHDNADTFYVIISQAQGRYDLFDYLVAVNSKLEVEKVKVLKYRSEHGGEIASKKWLEQFVGYSSGELKYKKDISAISGATISANSITNDVPLVLNILKSNLKIE
jgi:Na+-translocating ferredoxin:NAD+ oxidoreductase RnfG subunit